MRRDLRLRGKLSPENVSSAALLPAPRVVPSPHRRRIRGWRSSRPREWERARPRSSSSASPGPVQHPTRQAAAAIARAGSGNGQSHLHAVVGQPAHRRRRPQRRHRRRAQGRHRRGRRGQRPPRRPVGNLRAVATVEVRQSIRGRIDQLRIPSELNWICFLVRNERRTMTTARCSTRNTV